MNMSRHVTSRHMSCNCSLWCTGSLFVDEIWQNLALATATAVVIVIAAVTVAVTVTMTTYLARIWMATARHTGRAGHGSWTSTGQLRTAQSALCRGTNVRDRKMALSWGAHRSRRCSLFRLMLEILRFYPEAQTRSRIFRAIFRPLKKGAGCGSSCTDSCGMA